MKEQTNMQFKHCLYLKNIYKAYIKALFQGKAIEQLFATKVW